MICLCNLTVVIVMQITHTVKLMPFAATWRDLEITILSEVSQRKTNIIYHLYVDSKKMIQVNLFTKQKYI